MWRRGNSCTIDENVNWFGYYRKQYDGLSKNKDRTTIYIYILELLYVTAIPLLHVYPKEMKTEYH